MNFGFITRADCVNVPPPPDARCSDPAFAAANPDICVSSPRLILKPGTALVCALGSVQFRAFLATNGVEVDVTDDSVFATSDMNVAVIGARSGNCTGLSQGEVTVSATYGQYSATSDLSVMGTSDNCCGSVRVAMQVLVDTSKSMSLAFTGSYSTRLDFAKSAASRFIGEVNDLKDLIGLMSFNGTAFNAMSDPVADKAAVLALVPAISQTQQKTEFFNALNESVTELNATSADLKVIVLISDGEDTSDAAGNGYVGFDNPVDLLANFKDQGGIVICLGCRASGSGFARLSAFSTGGFFINAYEGVETDALDFLSGLKGYICAGNCTPNGDEIVATPSLDYNAFTNWIVSGGSVDLIGSGLLDLLPGNGLYVDLAGSTSPYYGRMVSRTPFAIESGHDYRVMLELAGNQRQDKTPYSVRVKAFYLNETVETALLDQLISINDYRQPFQPYSFTFNAPADLNIYISIQQETVPATANAAYGMILGTVKLDNATDNTNLLTDSFDTENLVYVPPRCGLGTTFISGGYITGYNCYGEGCMDDPVPIQLPDPNALSDVESGYPPIREFSSTKQACATCPAGTENRGDTLIPVMTSNTAPSGTASSSTLHDFGGSQANEAWYPFGVNTIGHSPAQLDITPGNEVWVQYQFTSPVTVAGYFLKGTSSGMVFTLYGSNDGITWTSVATQTVLYQLNISAVSDFSVATPATFSYWRFAFLPYTAESIFWIYNVGLYASAAASVCKTATATSTVSQQDADNKAYAAAMALAQAELNCAGVYTSTQQYTATCPQGAFGVSVTKTATKTSFISQADADALALAAAKTAAEDELDCTLSNNGEPIVLPAVNWNTSAYGMAQPFPSVKYVAEEGPINGITVTLNDLKACLNGNSFQIILRAPDGTCVILWSDRGTSQLINAPVTIVIDDAGAAMPVGPTALTSGTYAPNNGGLQPILTIPAVAPQPPYSLTLADLISLERQGSWSLWIALRFNSASEISSGWDITIS